MMMKMTVRPLQTANMLRYSVCDQTSKSIGSAYGFISLLLCSKRKTCVEVPWELEHPNSDPRAWSLILNVCIKYKWSAVVQCSVSSVSVLQFIVCSSFFQSVFRIQLHYLLSLSHMYGWPTSFSEVSIAISLSFALSCLSSSSCNACLSAWNVKRTGEGFLTSFRYHKPFLYCKIQ